MKKILLIVVTVLLSVSTLFSLEPLKVAYYTTSTGVQTVHVEIKDYSSGSTLFVGGNFSLTPNSNGIVIVNIQDHIGPNGDLSGINASTINTSVTVDVYVGTTLHSQHRLDNLIFDQASTTVFDNSGNFNPPTTNSSLGTDPNRWEDAFVGSNTFHVGPNNGMTGGTEMTLSYDEVNNKGVIAIDGTTSFEAKTTGITIPNLSGVGNRNIGVDADGNVVINNTPSVTAGNGLTLTTNTLDVGGSATIIANADDVEVNSSATANQVLLSSGTVGTAATYGALPLGDANAVSGTLPVSNGGTGATTLTTGNFLQGNGTGAVTATKAVPTGDVVGTTDAQTLTNKTINADDNNITNIFPDQSTSSGNFLTTDGINVSWGSVPPGAFTSAGGQTTINNFTDDFIVGDATLDHGGGTETKMFYDDDKGAFRVGQVNGNQWDDASIGSNSIAFGKGTTASGLSTTAMGEGTVASGNYSTALGFYTTAGTALFATAMGNGTKATGQTSTAMGAGTEASGTNSTSMGGNTIADANNSVAMGKYNDNTVTGELLTIGNGNSGIGNRSNAFEVYESGDVVVGNDLTVSNLAGAGDRSIGVDANGKLIELAGGGGGGAFTSAGGQTTINNLSDDFIVGHDSFDFTGTPGLDTESKMYFDDSKGALRAGEVNNDNWDNANIGDYSTAFGKNTAASGLSSTAMGSGAEAIGDYSTAMGLNTEAFGHSSTAMGSGAEAIGSASTAMGNSTEAKGSSSTAMGSGTKAFGISSTAMGSVTLARSYAETVVGSYNTDYTPDNENGFDEDDRVFVVGNGFHNILSIPPVTTRSDAMIVYKSGDTEINGNVTIEDDVTISNLAGGGTQNIQVDNDGKIITGGGGGGAFTSSSGQTTINNLTDDFIVGDATMDHGGGTETKMFYDDIKGAFRAGTVQNSNWDDGANIGQNSFGIGLNSSATGDYSSSFGSNTAATGNGAVAMGISTTASNQYTFASGGFATASGFASSTLGFNSTASGDISSAFGEQTLAKSYGEFVVGSYNTDYTPDNAVNFDEDDRVFVVGNGFHNILSIPPVTTRSDAMVVYKSGDTEINGNVTIEDDVTISNLAGGGTQNIQVDNDGKIITGGGGGGGGLPEVTVLTKSSDQTISSNTYTTITDFTTSLDANSTYRIKGFVLLRRVSSNAEANFQFIGLPTSGLIFLSFTDHNGSKTMIYDNEYDDSFDVFLNNLAVDIDGVFRTDNSGTGFQFQTRRDGTSTDDFIVGENSVFILTKVE